MKIALISLSNMLGSSSVVTSPVVGRSPTSLNNMLDHKHLKAFHPGLAATDNDFSISGSKVMAPIGFSL